MALGVKEPNQELKSLSSLPSSNFLRRGRGMQGKQQGRQKAGQQQAQQQHMATASKITPASAPKNTASM